MTMVPATDHLLLLIRFYAVRPVGIDIILIYANQPLRAAVKAAEDVLHRIKTDGGIQKIDELMVPVNHIFELQGVPEIKEAEKKYLR